LVDTNQSRLVIVMVRRVKKPEKAVKRDVKTRIKNPKLVDARRKQIIDGAIRIFSKKGFHASTVREIAEEAGLTMGC